MFNLIVGCICNKIKESTDNFNVIDPTTLLHKVSAEIHEEDEEEIQTDKNNKNKNEVKVLSLQQINSLI